MGSHRCSDIRQAPGQNRLVKPACDTAILQVFISHGTTGMSNQPEVGFARSLHEYYQETDRLPAQHSVVK